MKQPPASRFRRKSTTAAAVLSTNLRLVCSFNGTFCLRPPFNGLKYIGGETRIVSVDRNIGISKLRSKISDLSPKLNSFTLKYKLSFPGVYSDTCAPLVSVSSDDDVRRMVEDYREMELYGKKVRLWIFVCRDDDGFENCGDEIESSDDLFGDLGKVKLDPVNVGVSKIRSSDDSLRKSVLKQNLLAKHLEANDDLQDLSFRSEIEYRRFSDQPVEELYKGNMAVYKTQDAHLQGNYLRPLNPRDGNLKVEEKCCLNAENCAWNSKYLQNSELNSNCDYESKQDLGEIGHGISQLNLNWENITPGAVNCPYKSQWSGNAYTETPQICDNDARNPRAYPYHARNHRSKPDEKANNQIAPLNRKLSPHEIQQVPYQSFCEKYDAESITSELLTFDPYSSNGKEVEDSIDPTNIGSCGFSSYQTNGEAPQATSLLTSNDVSDSLVNAESKRSGLVDRERVLVAKVDKAVQWNFSDCKSAAEQKDQSPEAIDGMSTGLVPIYTDLATQPLQTIKHSDLEYIKELGSGTYGTVFHGKWKGSDVAIKKIKPSCFKGGSLKDDRLVEDFWKEAKILGQLHHPNIVAFYGVVTDGPSSNLATVTEYMVNGSLKQVLQRKDRTIDRRKRVILAMDAAFGMEYLHEKNIVHFDLKSHNLLVNMRDPRRPVCKIGDLGLSKVKQRTLVSGGVRGTIPWMAPELLNCENKMVTEKVDVFSFGIVMWELLTGEEPYSNLRSQELIGGIIKGSMRPEIPSWCDPAWKSLMERCWTSDPELRPSFSEIAKELRTMAAEMNIK